MTREQLKKRLFEVCQEAIPLPGSGQTPQRLRRLMEVGREDLSLAKLAEAHWDAVAILAEAGRTPVANLVYGVWSSEIPGKALHIAAEKTSFAITGTKNFCSGAGLIDRALITVGHPEPLLVDIDLMANLATLNIDSSAWSCDAFRETNTSSVTFHASEVLKDDVIGVPNWYIDRVGFWHGACGPAACWAGGFTGLVDFAMLSSREDTHTLAHLGAMHASVWALKAYLDVAGNEIDQHPLDFLAAKVRALELRHLVEETCAHGLRHFAKAYGPFPLSMNKQISRRYQETNLYMRQSHAEQDLELLARSLRKLPKIKGDTRC
jgi:hypothetical protein